MNARPVWDLTRAAEYANGIRFKSPVLLHMGDMLTVDRDEQEAVIRVYITRPDGTVEDIEFERIDREDD